MEQMDYAIGKFVLTMYVRGWVGLRARRGGFPVRGNDAMYVIRSSDLAEYSGLWFSGKVNACEDVNFSIPIRHGGRVWVGSDARVCEVMPDDLTMFGYRLRRHQGEWDGLSRVCGVIPL